MDALIDAQTYAGPEAAAATTPTQSGSFNERLAKSESGGNYGAQNAEGYSGKYQFGQERLDDYNRVKGTKYTTDDLLKSPELQESAQGWHVGDIDAFIQGEGLGKYAGQSVGGVPVTIDGMRAMAHLGGKGGMKKFLQSGGKYNPADSNGTRLSDYAQKFASASPAGQQMAAALRGGPAPGAIGGPAIPVRPPGPHGIAVPPPQAPPQAAITPAAGPAPQMPVPQPQQAVPARLRGMRAFDEDYTGPGSVPQAMQGVAGSPSVNLAAAAPPPPQMAALPPNAPQGGPSTPIATHGAPPPGAPAAAQPVQYAAPQQPGRPQRGTERDRAIYAAALNVARNSSNPQHRQMAMQAAKTAYENIRPLTRMERIEEQTARLGLTRADVELQRARKALNAPDQKPTTSMQEYEVAKAEGYRGSFTDFKRDIKKAGATNVTVTGNKYGKIPPGYQLVEGPEGARYEAIPGGPAAAKEAATATKKDLAKSEAGKYGKIVLTDINRVTKKIKEAPWYSPTAGYFGNILKDWAGTGAADVRGLMTGIQANIGFDRLNAMRQSSPTGGALGNVTERELGFLQSVLGSLEQSQSEEQLLENLDRLNALYSGIMRKFSAYPNAAEFGLSAPPSDKRNVEDVMKKYGG